MKKLLGTGALLLLIIYLLPVGYRVYAGTAIGDAAKDRLAAYAENGAGTAPLQVGAQGAGAGAQGAGADAQSTGVDVQSTGADAQGAGADAQGAGTGAQGAGADAQSAGSDAQDAGAGADTQGAPAGTGSVWGGGAAYPTGADSVDGGSDENAAQNSLSNGEITVLVQGEPQTMPLETYVEGVVAAEISPDFPEEAIRAQAVAARTYAVYKARAGRPMQHKNADVCDDYTHCAAYIDLAAAASARWGDSADSNLQKIRKAVQDTAGEILTIDGEPIVAVFHAASTARTESAKDIWGSEVSYLQSVASPGGSACEKYEGTVRLTLEEFRAKTLENYPTADLSGDPKRWFSASERSAAGSVIVCTLGGVQVKGTDLRTIFGLNSSNFTLTINEETIAFHTVGYGHGVGLSQYGAKYFAEQGDTYREILAHYYVGTEISHL